MGWYLACYRQFRGRNSAPISTGFPRRICIKAPSDGPSSKFRIDINIR
jgi:hypothetical protein